MKESQMRAVEFLQEIGIGLSVFVNHILFRYEEEGLFAQAPFSNQDVITLKIRQQQANLPKVLYYYFQLIQDEITGQLSHTPLPLQDSELNVQMAINGKLGLVKWPENEICILFLWPNGIFFIISISVVAQFRCAYLRTQLLYEGEVVRNSADQLLLRHPENAPFHCWSSLFPVITGNLNPKHLQLAEDGQEEIHKQMLAQPVYNTQYEDLTPGKATVVWYTESLNTGFGKMNCPASDGQDRFFKISSKSIKGQGFHALAAGEEIFATLERVHITSGPLSGQVRVQAKQIEKNGLAQRFATSLEQQEGLRHQPFAGLLHMLDADGGDEQPA